MPPARRTVNDTLARMVSFAEHANAAHFHAREQGPWDWKQCRIQKCGSTPVWITWHARRLSHLDRCQVHSQKGIQQNPEAHRLDHSCSA